MSTEVMAPKRNKRSEASKAIAKAIIDQYQPSNAEEMQDALRDIFGPMFEAMLQGEMETGGRSCVFFGLIVQTERISVKIEKRVYNVGGNRYEEKSGDRCIFDPDRSMSLHPSQSDQGVARHGRDAESAVMALLGKS